MRVEQAIYGEVPGRGHGLRASSPNARIAAAIASKLDLPDAVPPGVQAWAPFVRGFPVDEHYVLARTFLDSGASRGGMVLTHALIVSLDSICEIKSLTTLFGLLAHSVIDCVGSVAPLELDIADTWHAPAADLIGAANALTSEGHGPVVRVGVNGFELLVDSLWKNLLPTLRRTFAFRLSFGPNDVVEHPAPMLICTPEQLQARWTKHRIVQPDDRTASSKSARILSGQLDIQPILGLAVDLGLEIHTLRELGRLERLHTLLSDGESFDDLLAAIRLVDGISNQPLLGASIKDNLIARSTALIPSAGCKQLLTMRNLELSGFVNTQSLWSAVELLVSTLGFALVDDSDSMKLLMAAVDKNLAVPSWRAAVTAGLTSAAHRDTSPIFEAIWRWAECSEAAFAAAVSALPSNGVVEQRFTENTPRNLRAPNPDALLLPLLEKRWLEAYGAVLASMLPPVEATGQQLNVDKDPHYIAGLQSALRYASPLQVLECTLTHKDSRLVRLCADIAALHPQILTDICCDNVTEQMLWAAAICKNSSLWSAPSNATAVRDNVMAQIANGRLVHTGLVEVLAQTPLANLSSVPERERLWSLLPASQRDCYLQATATGWLNLAANGAATTPPEAVLESAIMSSSSLRSVLERSSAKCDALLSIVSAIPSFPEVEFIKWLDYLLIRDLTLSQINSERLGALIASRHWDGAAKYLVDRPAAHRSALMPGLRLCANLLNFYTSWALGISKPSAADKWKAFEQEACELYPSGPDCSELWSRAGGKNSDLAGAYQNGAARWRAALNSIRYGALPTSRALLNVMRRDFPLNEKLHLYAEDTDIVGRR